jgi:hypothetical protein
LVDSDKAFGGGFAAESEGEARCRGALAGYCEAFVGDVGEGHVPLELGEPEGVTASAASEVEAATGWQV